MRRHRIWIVALLIVVLVGLAGIYGWYRADLAAAHRRIAAGSMIVETADGPLEYAEAGSGTPVLLIHGAGGGFDQSLLIARQLLPPGYRVVAPSRFGYLRTLLPADAGADRQAAAHMALLDHLGIDRAVVIGVSAGTPSAVSLARTHPDRVLALGLVSPAIHSPGAPRIDSTAGNRIVLNAIFAGSDFAFWALRRFANATTLRFMGIPPELYNAAPEADRARVDEIIDAVAPLSLRLPGILNDGAVVDALGPYPLADLTVPVLMLCARDDLLTDCGEAERAGRAVPGVDVAILPSGGHLLLGRWNEARDILARFLKRADGRRD